MREHGHVRVRDLPPAMAKVKSIKDVITKEEISSILEESYPDTGQEIEFEQFLRVLNCFFASDDIYVSILFPLADSLV